MEARDLIIGSWVYRPDCYDQVKEIRQNGIIGIDSLRGLIGFSKITPIPLTPEILEKNEFVANKHVYPYPYYEYIDKESKIKVGFAFPQGDRTSYKEPWVYIDSEHVFIEHLPCLFVHQLQQILRLCGIEKEIEL